MAKPQQQPTPPDTTQGVHISSGKWVSPTKGPAQTIPSKHFPKQLSEEEELKQEGERELEELDDQLRAKRRELADVDKKLKQASAEPKAQKQQEEPKK